MRSASAAASTSASSGAGRAVAGPVSSATAPVATARKTSSLGVVGRLDDRRSPAPRRRRRRRAPPRRRAARPPDSSSFTCRATSTRTSESAAPIEESTSGCSDGADGRPSCARPPGTSASPAPPSATSGTSRPELVMPRGLGDRARRFVGGAVEDALRAASSGVAAQRRAERGECGERRVARPAGVRVVVDEAEGVRGACRGERVRAVRRCGRPRRRRGRRRAARPARASRPSSSSTRRSTRSEARRRGRCAARPRRAGGARAAPCCRRRRRRPSCRSRGSPSGGP